MTQDVFLSREPAWTDADFVRRSAALNWVASQFGREVPQNCNIVGEPRTGKTSLLHAVKRERIGLPPGQDGVYVWMRLVEWADRSAAGFWWRFRQVLLDELEKARLMAPGSAVNDGDEPWQVYNSIEDALEQVQATARVLVLIDDFDLLVPEITGQDLNWLRALATRFASNFAFMMTTTDPLEQLCKRVAAADASLPSGKTVPADVSPLYNIFATFHLNLLSEAETETLITTALARAGADNLAPKFAPFLRCEAGRHPDLLKVGVDYLLRAQAEQGGVLEEDDTIEALSSDIRYDANVRGLYERLFQRRSKEEQAMLVGLSKKAEPGDRILLRQMERKLGLVESREGQPAPFADSWQYWLERQETPVASGPQPSATAAAPAAAAPSFDYQPGLREVRVGERVRQLSPVEDRLLRHLMSKPNKACTAQELLDEVWGGGRTESVVEKTVNRLREKVEEDPARPRSILSLRGEGYMLRTVPPA